MQRRTCLTAWLNCKKVIRTQRFCGDNPNRATQFLLPSIAFTARDLTTRIHNYPPSEPAQSTRAMRLTRCPSVVRPTHRSLCFTGTGAGDEGHAEMWTALTRLVWCPVLVAPPLPGLPWTTASQTRAQQQVAACGGGDGAAAPRLPPLAAPRLARPPADLWLVSAGAYPIGMPVWAPGSVVDCTKSASHCAAPTTATITNPVPSWFRSGVRVSCQQQSQ